MLLALLPTLLVLLVALLLLLVVLLVVLLVLLVVLLVLLLLPNRLRVTPRCAQLYDTIYISTSLRKGLLPVSRRRLLE